MRDFIVTNGDLVLNAEGTDLVFVEAGEETAQHIRTELVTAQGTHSRNKAFGIPYLEEVLVRAPNTETIANIFRGTISARPDVTSVTEFEIDFDKANRELVLSFQANTDEGLVSVSV